MPITTNLYPKKVKLPIQPPKGRVNPNGIMRGDVERCVGDTFIKNNNST